MPPESKILLLIIGSANKRKGGDQHYDASASIVAYLPEVQKASLISGRARILGLIKRGAVDRLGNRITDFPQNRQLVAGPDLGGKAIGALYLPAARRFYGSFYVQLLPDGHDLLTNSRHHVLMLTPLYGLVMPLELIQDHDCHIDAHVAFRRTWTDNDRLTDVLIAYIQRFGITTVLDLTGLQNFRYLIRWSKARQICKKVLHCFGEQTWGSGLLTPLGNLTRELLLKATQNKIAGIEAGMYYDTPTDRIYFHSSETAPTGLRHELARQVTEFNGADEIVRMGRCIRAMLHWLGGEPNDESVPKVIRQLTESGHIPIDIKKHMLSITYERNNVEHKPKCEPTTDRVG